MRRRDVLMGVGLGAAGLAAPAVRSAQAQAGKTLVIGGSVPLTGAAADHRLPVASRDIGAFAQALAAELKVGEATPAAGAALPERIAGHAAWLIAIDEAGADDGEAKARGFGFRCELGLAVERAAAFEATERGDKGAARHAG